MPQLTKQTREIRKSKLFKALETTLSEHRGEGMIDDETALADVLADLRHIADKQGVDWDEVERRGNNHYEAEIAGVE